MSEAPPPTPPPAPPAKKKGIPLWLGLAGGVVGGLLVVGGIYLAITAFGGDSNTEFLTTSSTTTSTTTSTATTTTPTTTTTPGTSTLANGDTVAQTLQDYLVTNVTQGYRQGGHKNAQAQAKCHMQKNLHTGICRLDIKDVSQNFGAVISYRATEEADGSGYGFEVVQIACINLTTQAQVTCPTSNQGQTTTTG